MNLVPTASTTAALALGDALAMTLLVAKGFSQEHFASLHPGGKLGKRLMRVEQLMTGGERAPIVRASTPIPQVIYEMSSKGLGMTCVVDDQGALSGIITDGDLRRHMTGTPNLLDRAAADVMTHNPVTIRRETLAAEALGVLERRKITSIVVVEAMTSRCRASCTCTTSGAPGWSNPNLAGAAVCARALRRNPGLL